MTEPQQSPQPVPAPADDEAHLKLLSIFHWVHAGLALLCGCAGGVHALFMTTFFETFLRNAPTQPGQRPMPPEMIRMMSMIFGAFGIVYVVIAATSAVLDILAARWLVARRHRTFCFVVATLHCINAPLGTVLGVCTILVLSRRSVAETFRANDAAAQGA